MSSLSVNENTSITLRMLPISYTASFSPAIAQSIVDSDSGASVSILENTLETNLGAAPVGNVTVNMTAINPTQDPTLMPGDFQTLINALTLGSLESFGGIAIAMFDGDGNEVNLMGGAQATIRIPLSDRSGLAPNTMPLYYYESLNGIWVESGIATLDLTGSIPVYTGTVSRFRVWSADRVVTNTSILGCVVDAYGVRIPNAKVITRGDDYIGTSSSPTNGFGNFGVTAKTNSSVLVHAEINGNKTNTIQVNTGTEDVLLSECLSFGSTSLSITLTWGANPLDLDSYLYGPDFFVYYYDPGSLDSFPYAQLDVDDVDSFGPEVITITQFTTPGSYYYSVNNYSETFDPGITGSTARVELNNNGEVTLFVPPEGEGTNLTWNVFEIIVGAQLMF